MDAATGPATDGSIVKDKLPATPARHAPLTDPVTATVGAGVTVAAITLPAKTRPLNAMTARTARYFVFEKAMVPTKLKRRRK
jgi:hypothetical protein